jgi:hypothetical protein
MIPPCLASFTLCFLNQARKTMKMGSAVLCVLLMAAAAASGVPTLELKNAAQQGMTMPAIGLGTGGAKLTMERGGGRRGGKGGYGD